MQYLTCMPLQSNSRQLLISPLLLLLAQFEKAAWKLTSLSEFYCFASSCNLNAWNKDYEICIWRLEMFLRSRLHQNLKICFQEQVLLGGAKQMNIMQCIKLSKLHFVTTHIIIHILELSIGYFS